MLADLEGRFTEIIDNYEWESFTPEQRSLFMHWQHTAAAIQGTSFVHTGMASKNPRRGIDSNFKDQCQPSMKTIRRFTANSPTFLVYSARLAHHLEQLALLLRKFLNK